MLKYRTEKILRDDIRNNGDETPWGIVTELHRANSGATSCKIGGRKARADKKSPYFFFTVGKNEKPNPGRSPE